MKEEAKFDVIDTLEEVLFDLEHLRERIAFDDTSIESRSALDDLFNLQTEISKLRDKYNPA